jgi:hypothetical protein
MVSPATAPGVMASTFAHNETRDSAKPLFMS